MDINAKATPQESEAEPIQITRREELKERLVRAWPFAQEDREAHE